MKKFVRLTALAFVLAVTTQAALAVPVIQRTYCGDPCQTAGDETGCICWGPNGVVYRTICMCINGHWVG